MLEIIGQTRLEAAHEKLIAWLLTSRQAADYDGIPDVSFVFLTLADAPASNPRFKHRLLRDFYHCLRLALDTSRPSARPAHVRGRAVAEDYAATLERMLGLARFDQEAARYWLRHAADIKVAETAAQRMLECLTQPLPCVHCRRPSAGHGPLAMQNHMADEILAPPTMGSLMHC